MQDSYKDKLAKYNEIKKSYEECSRKIDETLEQFYQLKKEKNEYSRINDMLF
jgi:hypothetical protein